VTEVEKMLAAVLREPRKLSLEQVPVPMISDHEILIRVKRCGICGTDPHIYEGHFPAPLPLILGHEFSGEVVQTGRNVTSVAAGDKVTADINISCDRCYYCRHGQKLLCQSIRQLGVHVNGAFAEYIKVPESNVYKLPNEMTWEEAAYIEPLACAIHGMERANLKMGDTVAIIGAGPMGLALASLAKAIGAGRVIITELNPSRLAKAQSIGADVVLDASLSPVESVRELTDGRGADIVFEAVGSSRTYQQAFEMVRPGGTLVAYGAAPADAQISVKPFDIFSKELTIVGSYAGSYSTWSTAIEYIRNKIFIPSDIITNRIPLSDIVDGIHQSLTNKDIIKIMVNHEI
jgi:L-iditol 2-dehydrogenase